MNRCLRTLLVCTGLLLAATACGSDDSNSVLDVDASIDGVPISDSGPGSPQELNPTEESELVMVITNVSSEAVEVGHARLEGEMLGLTFLTYDTRLRVAIAPGETRELAVPLDFFDLDKQAHGYLRSWIRLYADNDDRTRLSSDEFVLDVRGSATSTMSIFAFLLFLVTGASLAHNLWTMRKGQLPPNRFKRGMRFAVTGLGAGLLLSVAFSVLRIFPLPTSGWVPLTVIPTLIGFGIGYLMPGAVGDESDDDDLEHLDDLSDVDDDLDPIDA